MNQRFYFNDCKFTLKPGQSLEHWQGGPTDEGYSFIAFVLTHHRDGMVTASQTSGGRDCDGEHRYYRDLVFDAGTWRETDTSEYDQFAQMMNY